MVIIIWMKKVSYFFTFLIILLNTIWVHVQKCVWNMYVLKPRLLPPSSPLPIGGLHEEALRSVVEGDVVTAAVRGVHAGVGRGRAAGQR